MIKSLYLCVVGILFVSCAGNNKETTNQNDELSDLVEHLSDSVLNAISTPSIYNTDNSLNFLVSDLDSVYIDNISRAIDSLHNNGKLTEYFYPDMSNCGGALYGYYYEGKLVKIKANLGAMSGGKLITAHLYDTTFYKSRTFENFTKGKVEPTYRADGTIDYNKTEYEAVEYLIYHIAEPIVQHFINGEQVFHHGDTWSGIYNRQMDCLATMDAELNDERNTEFMRGTNSK